jgi:hypothetical protein
MYEYTKGKWEVEFGSIVVKPEGNTQTIVLLHADREIGNGTWPTERDANIRRVAIEHAFCEGFTNSELLELVNLRDALQNARADQAQKTADYILDMFGD